MRSGTTNLPLHGGYCPPKLFKNIKELGGAIVEAIVLEFGPDEVLRRLADPGWFQTLGCVLGFDWHSSGLTTVLCGALKENINQRPDELKLYIAGGKGAASRKTPEDLENFVEKYSPTLQLEKFQHASKMAAKVDNNALQDKHQLYHHCFIITTEGNWTVIQQGMNDESGWARRYHWLKDDFEQFIEEPHHGICSEQRLQPLNLTDRNSRENRVISTKMLNESPAETVREYQLLLDYWDEEKNNLNLPDRHDIPRVNHLEKILNRLYEKPVENYEDFLGRKGVGPKTVRALAMVAEVVWGAKPSYEDPARYSFAHGGKDGYPHPVDYNRYRQTIETINTALKKCRAERSNKKKAFRRLSKLANHLTS
ncbi:MAG: DUF763 domain-containing protein [bacterium]